MPSKKIMVSICCGTYNHGKYIRQALDSFINQKTNFNYEILVIDDASTDDTPDILRDYEKRYPKLIRVIYNKKNMYSTGARVFTRMFELSKGKYISYCDGDDYYIDLNKIQKQFDYMEAHPDCGVVASNYKTYNDITGKFKKSHLKEKDYSVEEIIEGDGAMFATSSTFLRKSSVTALNKFYYISPFEDYVSLLNISLTSKIHVLSDYMSVYRINAVNSITTKAKTGDVVKVRKYLLAEATKMFNEFDKCTSFKYQRSTRYVLLKNEFIVAVLEKNFSKIKDNKFKDLYKTGNFKSRFLYFNKIHFPRIYVFLRLLKHKLERY